jgi:hypothetical protein
MRRYEAFQPAGRGFDPGSAGSAVVLEELVDLSAESIGIRLIGATGMHRHPFRRAQELLHDPISLLGKALVVEKETPIQMIENLFQAVGEKQITKPARVFGLYIHEGAFSIQKGAHEEDVTGHEEHLV